MPVRSPTPISELPEGFLYRPEFLSEREETELLRAIQALEFQTFDYHGYKARRRIVAYGWEYDFGTRKTSSAKPIPDFLHGVRERAAVLAGVDPDALVQAVITEYPPGAPIGWHRDVPQFDVIAGVSLASSCRMRLKPYRGQGKLVSLVLEPRSAYVMRGPARWRYQHSIPPVERLRYSITFRTLRVKSSKREAA
jgi:alkylated DNA repair dioxygenase AlkB